MTVIVAGHTGLVGSAIYELLTSRNEKVVGINSKVVDLLDRKATFEFINDHKPSVVIDAAAIVGGIGANNSFPVDFLSKNLQIQNNLMDASHEANVERFVFLGSSCIYPRACPQPIKEEYLLTGPLEATNSAYAIAKIAGIELIKSYRKQFNRRWISLMPTNMYGPRDNFDLNTSHVLPALINRFVTAKRTGAANVTLWGTGAPKREFLHSRDLASAVLLATEKYDSDLHLNIGTGEDLTIMELAQLIGTSAGYRGQTLWDSTKPDGTPRKVMDVSRLKAMGWSPTISLEDGIKETIQWFEANYN
ncbi:MAG: GDP-L-fucose synthase [Candidatus Nanopelagicaceae bacterium]|nr:GDP-L-fucose synthase [Candidatus Nanopelagicaceae bacterium]